MAATARKAPTRTASNSTHLIDGDDKSSFDPKHTGVINPALLMACVCAQRSSGPTCGQLLTPDKNPGQNEWTKPGTRTAHQAQGLVREQPSADHGRVQRSKRSEISIISNGRWGGIASPNFRRCWSR